jgi:hypothetical protein
LRQTPMRGSTPSRGDSRGGLGAGSTDNLTLHEIASMSVDPTPLRGKQLSSAPVAGTGRQQAVGPGGNGMAQFQSGGPVRVVRPGLGVASGPSERPQQQQRSAWNDTAQGQQQQQQPGVRAATPTRTVPGRQFGSTDPAANYEGGRAPPQPSYMSAPQRKASTSSINSGDDDVNSYSSDRNSTSSRGAPGDYNSLHNRVAPQRPNTTATGNSATQPRVYRHGSPAPNKARQAPPTGSSRSAQGSTSMYSQRPSSA